jgi:SAM-dependent methyltransferase
MIEQRKPLIAAPESPFDSACCGQFYGIKDGTPVYKCPATGSFFFPRKLTVEHDYETYYPYLSGFGEARSKWEVDIRRNGFSKVLRELAKESGGMNLLDVGAGPGFYLSIAQEMGFVSQGLESCIEAREFGKARYGVRYSSAEDIGLDSCDIIILKHVLEHIPEPIPFLSQLHSWLNPQGVVFIQVPIFQSPIERLMSAFQRPPRMYCSLYGNEHISGFTGQSLSILMEKQGFQAVRTWSSGLFSYDYDPIFIRSFLQQKQFISLIRKLVTGAFEQPFSWVQQGPWICGIFTKA